MGEAAPGRTTVREPRERTADADAWMGEPCDGAFTGNPATDFSIALLGTLIRCGVRELIVCPGSRSQALALVAAELARAGAVGLTVRIDERGAAFLALGTALETGVPAVVITTSGTATANLHPAILEAHHSSVPMIVLTADRPAELRGIRSNQTTNQPGMFGAAVRMMADAAAPDGHPGERGEAARLAREAVLAALGTRTREPGPVQLNLALREPLSAPVPDLTALAREARTAADAEPLAGPSFIAATEQSGRAPAEPLAVPGGLAAAEPVADPGGRAPAEFVAHGTEAEEIHPEGGTRGPRPAGAATTFAPASARILPPADRAELVVGAGVRTVVIAGSAAGAEAEEFARAGGWPLLAEVGSGARFGPNVVIAYRELLDDPEFGGRVERAVVFGHPTLSRQVPALLQRDGVEVVVVAPVGAEVVNPGHRAAAVARAVRVGEDVDPRQRSAREWVGRWVMASRQLAEGRPAAAAARAGLGPAGAGPADAGPAGVGPAGVGPAASAPAGAAPADAELAGVGPAASAPAGAGPAGVGPAGVGPAGVGPVASAPAGAEPAGAGLAGVAPASAAPASAPAAAVTTAPRSIPVAERADAARQALAELRVPVDREMLVRALWRFTWPHDRLLFGASRLIRDADRLVPGKKIRVLANRGLAGIDGTVATAIGVALSGRRAAEEAGRAFGVTRVLLGDLTLLHDAGSLLIGTGEQRPQIQLVVGNDGGGTIFDSLEVASSADRTALDRVLFTPQSADLASLAAAYGWGYTRAATRGELDAALSAPPAGPSIVEVPLER